MGETTPMHDPDGGGSSFPWWGIVVPFQVWDSELDEEGWFTDDWEPRDPPTQAWDECWEPGDDGLPFAECPRHGLCGTPDGCDEHRDDCCDLGRCRTAAEDSGGAQQANFTTVDAGKIAMSIVGPFPSRERAEEHRKARLYEYGESSVVWCFSGYHSKPWQEHGHRFTGVGGEKKHRALWSALVNAYALLVACTLTPELIEQARSSIPADTTLEDWCAAQRWAREVSERSDGHVFVNLADRAIAELWLAVRGQEVPDVG